MIVRRIPPPREATWFWRVLWGIAWVLKQFSARLEVEGLENLPAQGGFVVTCNHTRGLDYVPLGFSSPRQFYFMVKAEAFDLNPALTFILREGGGIPVQRGKADMHAFQVAIDKLNEGYPLAIFPEGTRSRDGTLQAAHTGAVRIAMHTAAPIIPAVVIGAVEMVRQFWKPWVRPRVLVRFGAPLTVLGDPADRALVHEETKRVMRTMAAMLPAEMRGIWVGDGGRVKSSRRGRRDAAGGSARQQTITALDGAVHIEMRDGKPVEKPVALRSVEYDEQRNEALQAMMSADAPLAGIEEEVDDVW